MRDVPLEQAHDVAVFGGKAVTLGAARRGGLPVPAGVALSVELVDAVARGEQHAALAALHAALGGGAVAVRSSAVGEDGIATSFAGQHVTKLNVTSTSALADAVRAVWTSGRAESALAYRARLGIIGEPRVAVVVQHLVRADVAGVLFTRDPVTGTDVRVIEAAWGFGEAVVAGLVLPDRYCIDRAGRVVERVAGAKDIMFAPHERGGIEELAVDATRIHAYALVDMQLARLHELACRCEQVFGSDGHDLEWAFEGDDLHLLQRRSITRSA